MANVPRRRRLSVRGISRSRKSTQGPSRIVNALGTVRAAGSGTLVDADDQRGLIITCAHLFREGTGTLTVTFPGGRSYAARLAKIDQASDLAALVIAPPSAAAVTIASDYPRRGDPLVSCGYGSDGRLWCNHGQALGYVFNRWRPRHRNARTNRRRAMATPAAQCSTAIITWLPSCSARTAALSMAPSADGFAGFWPIFRRAVARRSNHHLAPRSNQRRQSPTLPERRKFPRHQRKRCRRPNPIRPPSIS